MSSVGWPKTHATSLLTLLAVVIMIVWNMKQNIGLHVDPLSYRELIAYFKNQSLRTRCQYPNSLIKGNYVIHTTTTVSTMTTTYLQVRQPDNQLERQSTQE